MQLLRRQETLDNPSLDALRSACQLQAALRQPPALLLHCRQARSV